MWYVLTMIHSAPWEQLSPRILHDLIRLRVDVFVVEQKCPYPELDGRDIEASAIHVWSEPDAVGDGLVDGYVRVLTEPGGERRIGRVVVAPGERGTGLAGKLMAYTMELIGDEPAILDAQSPLVSWYERFGFTVSGPGFLEDGIPHTPMRRG